MSNKINLTDNNQGYFLDGHYYQYDLGWIIDNIKNIVEHVNTLYDNEIVHYADPIQWDITRQYTQNTVVVDPVTGSAYISKQPVPVNITLDNRDYWLPIFNFSGELDKIRENIGAVFPNNVTDRVVEKGYFVWYNGDLYKTIATLPASTQLRPNVNITPVTVDQAIATWSTTEIEWNISRVVENVKNGEYNYTNVERTTSGNDTAQAGDYTRTADNVTLSAKHFHIQSTATDLQYGEPEKTYDYYGILPMLDEHGDAYNLMVEQPNSPKQTTTPVTIVIGDSYSASSQSGTPLWYTYLNAKRVICHASDGQGFLTGNNRFASQLDTCKADVKSNEYVYHIYCVGGLNDLGNQTITNYYDFSNAVTAFIRKAKQLFPGVPITIGGVPPFQNYNFYSGDACFTDGQRADNFNLFMEYACSNAGVHFVNLRYLGLFTPEFFGNANASKQKHPSAAGEAAIASAMLGSPKYVNGVTYPALIPTVDNNCTMEAFTVTERNPNVVCISFTIKTGNATSAFNIKWNGFPRPPKYLYAYDGVDGCVAGATRYDQGVTNFFRVKASATYYLYYEVNV